MIIYDNFVTLCCFYDFRPPIRNVMIFYDLCSLGPLKYLIGPADVRFLFLISLLICSHSLNDVNSLDCFV